MKHIPHTSRVFIGLLIISLLLTYIAITLSHYQERLVFNYEPVNQVGSTSQPISTIDTKDWENYQDTVYPIAFSHPENWLIQSKLTNDFYDITVNIPNTTNDIHIYINEGAYYGLAGLQQEPYRLNTMQGSIVNNNLIGMKTGEYYYTFDASMNSKQLDEFHALMQTVTFQ